MFLLTQSVFCINLFFIFEIEAISLSLRSTEKQCGLQQNVKVHLYALFACHNLNLLKDKQI